MTTALSITSTRSTTSTDDAVAIGQSIPFVIAATGWVSGDRVTLTLKRVSDDVAVITKTVILTAASTSGTITKTWDLKTSRSVGNYYLYAVLVSNTAIHSDESCEIEVVMLNTWMLQNVYLAGIPYTDYTGAALDPQILEMSVQSAIGQMEEDMRIYFYPKTVRTQPEAGATDYDVQVDRLSYIKKDHIYVPFIKFPHYWIQSVEWLKGYIQNNCELVVNTQAIIVTKKRGFVRLVLAAGSFNQLVAGLGMWFMIGRVAYDEIPHFYDTKYVCGWDENIDGVYPREWLQALAWKAAVNALPIISDALRRGIGSESLSMDGISESESMSAVSGQTFLFSARAKQYGDWYDKFLRKMITKYRGFAFTVC